MSKIRILAVACLVSAAFAAFGDGGDLWDFPNLLAAGQYSQGKGNDPFWGQVHTPGAIYCWEKNPPTAANKYGKPCFDSTGGWWFGYADMGGIVKDAISSNNLFVGPDKDDCELQALENPPPDAVRGHVLAIEKYIAKAADGQNQAWKDLVVNYDATKETHYLVKGFGLGNATDGFDVIFDNPEGTEEDPSVSAIGFNWRNKGDCPGKGDIQNIKTEDLTKYDGLCVVYKADKGDANFGVDVELGWNEAVYDYNTWIVRLPASGNNWKTLDMKWEDFAPSYQSPDDFHPLEEVALGKAEALKFAFKNKGAAQSIHFQLKEVGWLGTCSGTASRPEPPDRWWENCDECNTPVAGSKIASAYKFNLNGRMLSVNFAGPVQVINLQGAIVAKKTLAANEGLSLANLPVGIYMVRSEKFGIVQKIMVK